MQERKLTPLKLKRYRLTGGVIKVYSSIKELPTIRWNQLNAYLAQDMGIGSDMRSVDRHYQNLDTFIRNGEWDNAKQERLNLHYNWYMIVNGISIKSRAFMCIVHSINGVEVGNLEDEDTMELALRKMEEAGATVGDMQDALDEIKKKLIPS